MRAGKIIIFLSFSMMFLIAKADTLPNLLLGKKLIIEGESCAGISFSKNGKNAFMYAELSCKEDDALALRVRWLDSKTFILIEKDRPNEISPPRTFVFKVKNISGQKITLNEIWTGWNDFKDEEINYSIE